jgi:RNase P subunit RPR2
MLNFVEITQSTRYVVCADCYHALMGEGELTADRHFVKVRHQGTGETLTCSMCGKKREPREVA